MTDEQTTPEPRVALEIGQWVDTKRHGGGYVRGISHTHPEIASIDIELVDAGEVLGWVTVAHDEIVQEPAQ